MDIYTKVDLLINDILNNIGEYNTYSCKFIKKKNNIWLQKFNFKCILFIALTKTNILQFYNIYSTF